MFPGTPDQSVVDQLEAAGITVLDDLSLIDALAVQLPPTLLGIDLALALLQELTKLGVVELVVDDLLTFVDPICPTTAPPSVQEYRWGTQQSKVPAAHEEWPQPKETAAVTVAVLDTGIASSNPELSGRIVQGYNAITGTTQTADGNGHGTHMAGIIMAKKNTAGVVGVAGVEPKITVVPVKVLDNTGAGYLSVVIKGLDWVLQNHDISVVNMSFGFVFLKGADGSPLKKAIQRLSEADIIMVASAGNRCQADGGSDDGGGDGCGPSPYCVAPLVTLTSPADYQEHQVIAVGATDSNERIATYSLLEPQLALVAPGGESDSREPDNGEILSTNIGPLFYGRGSGTSQAAAQVTGAVALALALDPTLTPKQVRQLLTQTAVTLPSGARRIDVKNMIEALLP
jgi:subtilisin family serine protease